MKELVMQVSESILYSLQDLDSRSVNDNVIVLKDLLTVTSAWFEDVEIRNAIKEIDKNLKIAISSTIKNKESKSTKSFTDSLLKIDYLITTYNLDFYDEVSKSESLKLTAEQLLDISINNKVLIKTYDISTRGIGKTTALIKKADKLKVSILTSNATSQSLILKNARNLNIEVDVVRGISSDSVRGLRLTNNKFLVDEGCKEEVINQLIKDGNELIGGFTL